MRNNHCRYGRPTVKIPRGHFFWQVILAVGSGLTAQSIVMFQQLHLALTDGFSSNIIAIWGFIA